MKRALLLLCFAFSVQADDSEIAKGLQNHTRIYAIATYIEAKLAVGAKPEFRGASADPWGTPYRIDADVYRIVSAGSDGKFDEASWATREQFPGTEGDVVFEKGEWVRTNHNWLCKRVTADGPSATALDLVRKAEFGFIGARTEPMRSTVAPRMTMLGIESLAAGVELYRSEKGSLSGLTLGKLIARGPLTEERDAWGTRLRLEVDGESYRIVSAGADRRFDPESWKRPPTLDPAEDIVHENGRYRRRFDERAFLENAGMPTGTPVKQPPDARLTGARIPDLKEKGKVTPPVVLERVEPKYPEEYRQLRISGVVIVETSISDTGTVGDVSVIKSIGPALDMAAVDAVRQWTFKPALAGDEPIPVLFNLTINFKLD
jgi:TonB family protein